MTFKKNRLPQGVQDYLPEECYNKNLLEGELSRVYGSWGYRRIETAGFEYLSTFDVKAGLGANKIFKFTDYDGSLLALRPDPTLQIARMAADYGMGDVRRYYYVLNSYEFSGERVSAGRTREFAQTGVELLGAKGVDADAEIIMLAVDAMKKAGIKDFLIEIGTVEFFKALTEELRLDESCTEEIRYYINQKDTEGLRTYLQKFDVSEEDIARFIKIPKLFGGEGILDEALLAADGDRTKQALLRLKELAAMINKLGLTKYCSYDLGLVPELNYYSGLVIRGIAPSLGQPLLSGGRYDGLSKFFGADIAAVGFSVGTKRLLMALEKQSGLLIAPPPDYVYYVADGESEAAAYKEIGALRAGGAVAIRALGGSFQQAVEFCRECKADSLMVFANGQQSVRGV